MSGLEQMVVADLRDRYAEAFQRTLECRSLRRDQQDRRRILRRTHLGRRIWILSKSTPRCFSFGLLSASDLDFATEVLARELAVACGCGEWLWESEPDRDIEDARCEGVLRWTRGALARDDAAVRVGITPG
jgi:hypothetical protein